MDGFHFAISAPIQISLANAQDATMRAHPKISDLIIYQMRNTAIGQTLAGTDTGKFFRLPARQSIVGSADPQTAIGFSQQTLNKLTGQSIPLRKLSQCLALERSKAAPNHPKPN